MASKKTRAATKKSSNLTTKISNSDQSSSLQQHECIVCEEFISDGELGQESIMCEGQCKGWLHRVCAGLSKSAFKFLTQTRAAFHCYPCKFLQQEKSIMDLNTRVNELHAKLSALESASPIVCMTAVDSSVNPSPSQPQSQYKTSQSPTYSSVVNSNLGTASSQQHKPAINQSDRKYNLVFYGIEECQKGTPKFQRSINDTKAVLNITKIIDPDFSEHSLCDCSRLGRFNVSHNRPILVKFSRSRDVVSLLSNRYKLASTKGFFIKPLMSRDERRIESILLKKRRDLITSGVSSSQIKLRGNLLFVNKKRLGSVANFQFCPVDAPHINNSSASNPTITQSYSDLSLQHSPPTTLDDAPVDDHLPSPTDDPSRSPSPVSKIKNSS